MAADFTVWGGAMELVGRRAECEVLDRLIEAVRVGESRALVVSGEAGVGKTALLEYLVGQASGCRLARIAGVQSEMELPFAALHQLCAPMLDKLQGLPVPQRDALKIAFGMSPGSAPDRFMVGLAVLSLLSEVAEEQPLVCVIDDEQWLDRASVQVLGFAARRLGAESVGLIFAARVPSSDIAGLPDLVVERLGETDARALLDSALTGPLDTRVRDQIVAEAQGNPLALLELPRGLTPQELAGGGSPRPGPAPAAHSRGRAGRRSGAGVGGCGAAGDRRRSGGAGDGGGPSRVRHASAVSSSPRALGGLRVGVPAGATTGARCAVGGHRSRA
jgi:hypothetical protein